MNRSFPHSKWPPEADQNELDEIRRQRNIDIMMVGRTGPVKEFEEQFKAFLNNEMHYVISFNSGTSGLFAAYFAIGVDEGDFVLGPALTYHAALSPVFMLKGNVRLVDVDINSRCIDAGKIEENICEKTKAITVVHEWGHPAEMDKILKIASKYNLKVIEDCSHAHGSTYKGKLCGTFGDVAVFSLHARKSIYAGEGGILVTNNQEIHDRATLLGHYRERSKYEIKNSNYHKYWFTGFGLKLRLSPFNAIIAKHSLMNFPTNKAGRKKCLEYLNKRLEEILYIRPIIVHSDADMGAWYGYRPLYDKEKLNGLERDYLVNELKNEGLDVASPNSKILANEPLYYEEHDLMFMNSRNKYTSVEKDYPNAQYILDTTIILPTFYDWENDKAMIDHYIDVFKKIETKYKIK